MRFGPEEAYTTPELLIIPQYTFVHRRFVLDMVLTDQDGRLPRIDILGADYAIAAARARKALTHLGIDMRGAFPALTTHQEVRFAGRVRPVAVYVHAAPAPVRAEGFCYRAVEIVEHADGMKPDAISALIADHMVSGSRPPRARSIDWVPGAGPDSIHFPEPRL